MFHHDAHTHPFIAPTSGRMDVLGMKVGENPLEVTRRVKEKITAADLQAWQQGRMMEHVFCAFLGQPPRELAQLARWYKPFQRAFSLWQTILIQ